MTLLEEQQKLQSGISEPVSARAMGEPHPDGYGDCLKDPDVIVSKGRPQERYKTFMEKLQAKQNIECDHCGQHDHDFGSCTNKHIPRSQFQKKSTRGGSSSRSSVVPTGARRLPSETQKGGNQKVGKKAGVLGTRGEKRTPGERTGVHCAASMLPAETKQSKGARGKANSRREDWCALCCEHAAC